MILLDIEQDTPAWHEVRRTKIGGSDAPCIMGVGFKKPSQVMEEKLLAKTSFQTSAMRRGKIIEPIARDYLSKIRNTDYKPVVGINQDAEWQMASLDGWDGTSFTEIKSPNDETFQKVKRGDTPIDYYWQIQHQCCVFDAPFGYLDVFKTKWVEDKAQWVIEDYQSTKIEKDEASIVELLAKEYEFYERMINFQYPPDETSKPIPRQDHEAAEVTDAIIKAKILMEEAKERYEIVRDGAILVANEVPYRCNGVIVRKLFVKGDIDYDRILKEHGIDKEKYRKPPRIQWRVECPKTDQEQALTG